jgi:DNA polymerase-3 subunit beta
MTPIKIPLPLLKTLLLTAGKNDARTFLNGIHFEYSPHGAIAITTDGHRMTCARLDYDGDAFPSFTLSPDGIKSIKTRYDVSIDYDAVHMSTQITTESGTMTTRAIEGTWPDWRRVIPDKFSGEPASYNFYYLGDIGKACKLMDTKSRALVQNGDRGAMVNLSDDVIIILMPIREVVDYCRPTTPPLWTGRAI